MFRIESIHYEMENETEPKSSWQLSLDLCSEKKQIWKSGAQIKNHTSKKIAWTYK